MLWSRFKRATRRAWTWCWSREWFAMVFFLVVMAGLLIGLAGCAAPPNHVDAFCFTKEHELAVVTTQGHAEVYREHGYIELPCKVVLW